MARMPGAVWKPLPRGFTVPMSRFDLVVLHTMVGSLAGTDSYFRGLTNGVNSHFGTGGGGEKWQWGDTAYRSGANGGGNHRAVTVENADMGPGFAPWNTKSGADVPAFTDAQIEANAEICAWSNEEHGVPLVPAPNSLPGSRGVGYHRLGIDPWRVPGGEKWSSSYGKVCPADRRVAQVPTIIGRAVEIRHGSPINRSLGDDMSVAIAVGQNKTCWIDDGTKVWWTADINEVGALCKLWGIAPVPMADAEIQKVITFRSRRKAEYEAAQTAALVRALPGPNLTDEQIKAMTDELAAQLAPKVGDAKPVSDADLERIAATTAAELAERLGKAS